MGIISTLPPIHIPSYIKLAWIVFVLSWDPDFSGQTHLDYFHYHSSHNFHVTAKKKMCITSTLQPVYIPSYIKLAWIVFVLSPDPDFSRQTDGQTYTSSVNTGKGLKSIVDILKCCTLVACQKKSQNKQCRPRSDCFFRSSLIRVFPVCFLTNILWIPVQITSIL